jgi:hypothetical protein
MSVVTHPAAFEHSWVVSVDSVELVSLMAIEAAPFENKRPLRLMPWHWAHCTPGTGGCW